MSSTTDTAELTRRGAGGGDAPDAGARLLVVDDEQSVSLTIGEVLRREGFEVDTASSGSEAGALLHRFNYDLVLTDLHMEGGDGLSVLEAVRAQSPFTISLVLTGFASAESAIAALRHGAFDFLVKPCIIDELKLTVRRGLEHRRLMIAEQEARAALEALNRDLERRVEERTSELQKLNRELSEANRAKDIFLATLSHELRTPLTPVLGWVNLLRNGIAKGMDSTLVTQGLDAIERNARLQARLIDDLLDISRVISGKLRIEFEPINLCDTAIACAETVREQADARSVTLDVSLPSEPLVVQGSPVRLQQIVWNLLTNAVKFTPDGGRVEVRAFRRERSREACVAVSDTGVGIEPDFLPHVFDMFRQADGSTTRQHGGLGLGLAIVRALAELHGGRVSAESGGAGKGSTFTFSMPSDISADGAHEAAPDDSSSLEAGLAVLVVEDDPETLEMMKILFRRKGCAVLAAENGAQAVEMASQKPPAVIISDIQMPEMDGYELLARLRRLPGLERVPAIALSGYAMDEDRDRALAAGFDAHVPKPAHPEELFDVVQRLTGK